MANKLIRRVFIRDFELHAQIGVHGHEQSTPQPIRINVVMTVDPQDKSDQLEGTVDYEAIAHEVRAIVDAGHINLAETLAERIADSCLEKALVNHVLVRVEKLHALTDVESVGAEIERRR